MTQPKKAKVNYKVKTKARKLKPKKIKYNLTLNPHLLLKDKVKEKNSLDVNVLARKDIAKYVKDTGNLFRTAHRQYTNGRFYHVVMPVDLGIGV